MPLWPKFPIRRVVEAVGYNGVMRKPTEEQLKSFKAIDRTISDCMATLDAKNFQKLWIDEKEYKKHLARRIADGAIDDENDYIGKIKEAFDAPDTVIWKKFTHAYKELHGRYDRIYYMKGNWWVDIFFENGKISTAFVLNRQFSEIVMKGDKKVFDLIDIPISEVRDER